MDSYKCINDLFSTRQKEIFKRLPKKDEVYTLREIVKSKVDGKEGFLFEELPNPKHDNGQEYSFRPSRFVPVDKININSLINERELSI